MHISPGSSRPAPMVGAVHFLYLKYENSGNSAKTARDPAVFPIPEPLTAQDFRGRTRYRWLIISYKTAKTAKQPELSPGRPFVQLVNPSRTSETAPVDPIADLNVR